MSMESGHYSYSDYNKPIEFEAPEAVLQPASSTRQFELSSPAGTTIRHKQLVQVESVQFLDADSGTVLQQ